MNVNSLAQFIKSGSVVTDALGLARVIFREPFTYGTNYVVVMACVYPGQATIAYSSNIAQTGFTISTRDTKQPSDAAVPTVTVHWIAIPVFNA
jgi:hypothetical protein